MPQIKYIRLDQLIAPEFDVRLPSDDPTFPEFCDSIREHGIILPLVVRKKPQGYEIIIGNRRYQAATIVGLTAAPCIVRKASDSEADLLKMHENMKRLDMSHVDQAQAFEHFRSAYKMTEAQIATMIGKSIGYVSQHLTLLHTDPLLVAAVRDGRLNFSVARELTMITDPEERKRFMDYAQNNGATADTAKEWVRQWKKDAAEMPKSENAAIEMHSNPVRTQPLYLCAACEKPLEISKLHLIRMCHSCFLQIFAAVEASRTEAQDER